MEKLRSRDENCNDENPRVFISKDIRENYCNHETRTRDYENGTENKNELSESKSMIAKLKIQLKNREIKVKESPKTGRAER